MLLAHHPEALASLRIPTREDPWRVLLSGCLAGWKVAVDGTDYGLAEARPSWLEGPLVRTIPFCPEDHVLGTPRPVPDLHGGDGFAVIAGKAQVLDPDGKDLTEAVMSSSGAMVDLARENDIDFAILTDRSGTCGSQVISLGCRLEGPIAYRKGVGVAAAMLLQAGFHVVSQRDFRTLGLLHQVLEPGLVLDAEALDHHQHPWVLENL
ncbi:MAG: 2-thiouracil desulfurase family protein [Planctomycetota bacterium]|jgi:uncharacterized protein YbbK (DUF523 family)